MQVTDEEGAARAIADLQGIQLEGRELKVSDALRQSTERPPPSSYTDYSSRPPSGSGPRRGRR